MPSVCGGARLDEVPPRGWSAAARTTVGVKELHVTGVGARRQGCTLASRLVWSGRPPCCVCRWCCSSLRPTAAAADGHAERRAGGWLAGCGRLAAVCGGVVVSHVAPRSSGNRPSDRKRRGASKTLSLRTTRRRDDERVKEWGRQIPMGKETFCVDSYVHPIM